MKNPLENYNYDLNIEKVCQNIEDGQYDDIIDQSHNLIVNEQKSAFYIPGVKMVLDLSLDLLNDSSISDYVKEVFDRQVIATNLVKEIVANLACRSITDPNENNNPLVNLYSKFGSADFVSDTLKIED